MVTKKLYLVGPGESSAQSYDIGSPKSLEDLQAGVASLYSILSAKGMDHEILGIRAHPRNANASQEYASIIKAPNCKPLLISSRVIQLASRSMAMASESPMLQKACLSSEIISRSFQTMSAITVVSSRNMEASSRPITWAESHI